MTAGRLLFLSAAILLLAGCAVKREVLVPHSDTAPSGVDFSGTWLIRGSKQENQQRINHLIQEMDGVQKSGAGIVRVPRKDAKAGFVHVFLETGRLLKISQTDYAFFVSVDRSVVEEFRFGEARRVNVGQVVADRVSGWVNDVYVVETLDKNNVKLTERFWLSERQQVLNREITIRNPEGVNATALQQFDRQDGR